MEYRRLGNSGLEVSAVGLGANNFGARIDVKQSSLVIDQALDIGVNLIDTSNSYGPLLSEEYIGKALKGKRHHAIIATKVASSLGSGPNQKGTSRAHILQEVENSLERLQTDYIDVYYLHRPDPLTPISETLRALDDLIHQGKVRYIGCSGFSAWAICEAIWQSRTLSVHSFSAAMFHHSIMTRDPDRVSFCNAYQVGIVPFYALENGFLTGKYRRGEAIPSGTRFGYTDISWANSSRAKTLTDTNFDVLEGLEAFASERGKTVGALALSWLLANNNVSSVLAGATKPEQVVANAAACDWKLTEEDMAEIEEVIAATHQ